MTDQIFHLSARLLHQSQVGLVSQGRLPAPFHDPDGHTFEIYSEVFATGQEGLAYMRAQAGYGVTEPITL